MLLADCSCAGVDGDHGEPHLQDPAVHDGVHRTGQLNTSLLNRLVKVRQSNGALTNSHSCARVEGTAGGITDLHHPQLRPNAAQI